MGNVYERYFDGREISDGKASMMKDIRKHRLAGSELAALIDDLESRGMLLEKPFTPRPRECWDENYLSRLSNGYIADYFSRAYLEHYGAVAEYVCRQARAQRDWLKTVLAIGGVVLAVAAAALLYRHLSLRRGPAGSAALPSVQLEPALDKQPLEIQNTLEQDAAVSQVWDEFPQGISPQSAQEGSSQEDMPQGQRYQR